MSQRICRRLKWLGLIFCALILAAWLASSQYYLSWIGGRRGFYCSYGRVVYMEQLPIAFVTALGPAFTPPGTPLSIQGQRRTVVPTKQPNWIFISTPEWVKDSFFGWPSFRPRPTKVRLPLWCVLLPSVVLTALLWWSDRPTPGHCRKCGYNLTGNVSGVCPECGTPIPKETSKNLTNSPSDQQSDDDVSLAS